MTPCPLSRVSFIIFSLLCVYAPVRAQQGTFRGQLQDAVAATPLAYANIRVYKATDNELAGGALSAESGMFSVQLPFGTYRAEVEYIGFETVKTDTFSLSRSQSVYDAGILKITAASRSLGEVEIVAEKSSMVLSLDKKIFNIGKDLANAGGSATEILTNIPSVSVDPDGTVKLRGSDNVRILIDGKPSGLVSFKGSAGLQQLQASMIDRVEIITNPSARYEAEGSGGIINIVLKKDQKQGFNGSFELISGYPYNFGASANLNYRHKKVNFFINYGIAYRKSPGGGDLYQRRTSGDTTFILLQTTENKLKTLNNNIRGGLDYFFTENSILTASYLWRRSDANRISSIRYEDYLFNSDTPLGYTLRQQDEIEDEPNSEYSLIYRRKFSDEGHEFTAEAKYLNYWEHSDQSFPQQTFFPNGTEDASKALFEKSLNDEYENQYLLQLDYVRPLGKDGKFETGLRSSFRDMVNDYLVTSRNSNGMFEVIPGLDNYFIYNENINGAYLIYGNKRNKFSFQGGIRAEHTDIETILRETGETNPRKYFNFFPSVHLTYELPDGHAIQWSYSRRVRRPVYFDLSPFFTYTDKRNYWSGNPNLNPEFSDVIEFGHVKYFDKGSMASSVYYRHTNAKIDHIRLLDAQGIANTRPENLNFENALGFEFTTGYSPVKWCKLDANFNLFHARIDGSNLDATFLATTNSWFARLTSRFTLPNDFDFQLRGNYEAPQRTAQGSRKALYYLDLAASQDVLQKRGTLTLNISDVFNTRKWRGVTEGAGFYTESSFQWRRRQINMTFNYRIKQAKAAPKKPEE